jgi:hypothetical protein
MLKSKGYIWIRVFHGNLAHEEIVMVDKSLPRFHCVALWMTVTISGILGIPLVNLTGCEIFRLLALMDEWQSGTLQ